MSGPNSWIQSWWFWTLGYSDMRYFSSLSFGFDCFLYRTLSFGFISWF